MNVVQATEFILLTIMSIGVSACFGLLVFVALGFVFNRKSKK